MRFKKVKPHRRTPSIRTKARRQLLKSNVTKQDNSSLSDMGLLHAASHEISTSLNGVIGMLEILLASGLTAPQQRFAHAAQTSAEQLCILTQAVLDLVQNEVKPNEVRLIPFNVRQELTRIFDALTEIASQKDVELTVQYATERPLVLIGDLVRIERVFTILITWAVLSELYQRVQIVIGFQNDAAQLCNMSFRINFDHGVQSSGATASESADTGNSSSYLCSGNSESLFRLLAQRLLNHIGGQLQVERINGLVNTLQFNLALPIAPSPLSGIRMLVADANESKLFQIKALLEQHGMRVDTVDNAADMLTALTCAATQNDAYRVALLDRQIRGIDEELVGPAIKTETAYQNILLIMSSADQLGDPERLAANGFSAYLRKPFDNALLVNTLDMLFTALNHNEALPFLMDTILVLQSKADGFLVGRRILVADDNPINQQVAQHMLSQLGCHIDVASNGRQAVAMHEQQAYDAILMDCDMPELDGFQATAHIRTLEASECRTPIIAWTADTSTEGGGKMHCRRRYG
jgi:CheY-like chemotaxis protein